MILLLLLIAPVFCQTSGSVFVPLICVDEKQCETVLETLKQDREADSFNVTKSDEFCRKFVNCKKTPNFKCGQPRGSLHKTIFQRACGAPVSDYCFTKLAEDPHDLGLVQAVISYAKTPLPVKPNTVCLSLLGDHVYIASRITERCGVSDTALFQYYLNDWKYIYQCHKYDI